MAEFPGGMSALMQWMKNTVRYPQQAAMNGVQGTVLVKFVVDKEGKVVDATIARSIDTELDNEALRVVNEMPQWTPAELNGEPVASEYTFPVAFRLNNKPAQKKDDSAASSPAIMTVKSGDREIVLNTGNGGSPTIMINGKISDMAEYNAINSADISLIEIFRDDPKYPNGLVKIVLKEK